MRNLFLPPALVLLSLLLVFPGPGFCGEDPAKEEEAGPLVTGPEAAPPGVEGMIRGHLGGLRISADRIVYEGDTDLLRADGSVVVRDETREFRTDSLVIGLGTKEATAGAGTFLRDPDYLRVDADSFRGEPSRIHLENCRVTSCTGEDPDWSLASTSVWATPQGYMHARGTSFRIRDVPVLYTPYVVYPVSGFPRSGLLMPAVGHGERDGFRYFQPLYWLIGPDRDATVTVEYRSERAWGADLEYRMLLGTKGDLDIGVHVVDDWNEEKTFLAGRANGEYRMAGGGRAFLRAQYLTEDDFFREFSRSFGERILRYGESAGEVSVETASTRVRFTGRFLQNLTGSSSELPVALRVGTDTYAFSGLRPGGAGEVTLRVGSAVGARVRDGGEDVYTMRIAPRLEFPFSRGLLAGGVFLDGYGEGFSTGGDPDENGLGIEGGIAVEIGTRFGRTFGSWGHILEPRLRYDHRLSGGEFASDTGLEAPGSVRLIGVRLVNRIFRGTRQAGVVEISGGVDPGRDTGEWEPVRVVGMLEGPFGVALEAAYDPNDRRLSLWSSSVRILLPRGYLLIGHRYDRTAPDEEPTTASNVEIAHAITHSFYGTSRLWYDLDGGGVREFLVSVSWVKDCWGVGVSFVNQLEESRVLASVFLKGLGYLGTPGLVP